MANQNRFGSMFEDIKADEIAPDKTTKPKTASKAQEANESDKPKAKYKDPNYVQVGLYLPKDLHQKLKIGSAITEKELSDIAAEVLSDWVDRNVPNI